MELERKSSSLFMRSGYSDENENTYNVMKTFVSECREAGLKNPR